MPFGAGSKWINNGNLYVGYQGKGTLSIQDGGKVTATGISIRSTCAVNLYVSGNDMLVLGNATTPGSVTNIGAVHLYAGAFLAPGTYRPISDSLGRTMTWSGVGTYDARGGTWDATNHTFTVADAIVALAGDANPLSNNERLVIGEAGHRVGASFGAVQGLTFSATPMDGADQSGLALTPAGSSVLSAWDFTFSGDASTNPVLLSFEVGQGASDVQVWHHDANGWTTYTANDLVYGNGIVSFTAKGFSGYAVTGIVPEPTVLGPLGMVAMGILARRRRG